MTKAHTDKAYAALAAYMTTLDFEKFTGRSHKEALELWNELKFHTIEGKVLSDHHVNLRTCWESVHAVVSNPKWEPEGYWVCNAIKLVTAAFNPALRGPMMAEVCEWLQIGQPVAGVEDSTPCLIDCTACLKANNYTGLPGDLRRIRLEFVQRQIDKCVG